MQVSPSACTRVDAALHVELEAAEVEPLASRSSEQLGERASSGELKSSAPRRRTPRCSSTTISGDAVAVEVADRRRAQELRGPLVARRCRPAASARAGRRDRSRPWPGPRCAPGKPGRGARRRRSSVEVAVERRDDDLELPVAGGVSRSPSVGAAITPRSVSFRRLRLAGVGEARGSSPPGSPVRARAVGAEHVELPSVEARDDLERAVAVEVVGGERRRSRSRAAPARAPVGEPGRRRHRQQIGVGGEARAARRRSSRGRRASRRPSRRARCRGCRRRRDRRLRRALGRRAERERCEAQRRVRVDRHGAAVLADVSSRVGRR